MITISVNDVKYKVPQSWDDITIAQQIEISEVVNRDEQFRNLHLVSTYTGIPLDLVKRMNINQFKQVLDIMKFLTVPYKPKIIKSFTHNGKEYFLADSLLAGETQDFLSIEGILKRYKDNQTKALPYVIAIVAKQNSEKLDDYDVWKRGEEFKTLPYSVANNVWFFFAQTEKALSINIKQFLGIQDKVMEASLSYSESTLKQSVGQTWLKKLLKATLLLYIRFIRKSWKNFSTTIQSEPSKENWRQRFKKRILSKLKRNRKGDK